MFTEIVAVGSPTGVSVFDLRRGTRLAAATGIAGGTVAGRQGFALTQTWIASCSAAKAMCNVHILNRGDSGAKLSFPLPEHISCVAATAEDGGRYLAAGAQSGRILVWATGSGRMLRSWDAHYGAVTALAWSGGALVSGGEDGAVHVWSLAEALMQGSEAPPVPVASMAEHTMAVTALWVSRMPVLGGLGRVYSASRDHTVKQWRICVRAADEDQAQAPSAVRGYAEVLCTLLYAAAVRGVAVDAAETRVFAATGAGLFQSNLYVGGTQAVGGPRGSVVSDGHIVFPCTDGDSSAVAVALSTDSTVAVSASATSVRVWDTASRQCLHILGDSKAPGPGAQQLTVMLAPPQLGGPRAAVSCGPLRPVVLSEAVIAPKISAISFQPLQRLAQRGATTSATAFDAPVRTRLVDSAREVALFETELWSEEPYAQTAVADADVLDALRPKAGSAEHQVAELLQQNERMLRHHQRTRKLNDELYQSAVTEWLQARQKA
ncbi:Pre-rRNA-processing protein ipi3 [Coemansia sp. Benny D115]|nr:Pre-rRNA-processing protein ipi3 [Coemansia sp. Benny D115]